MWGCLARWCNGMTVSKRKNHPSSEFHQSSHSSVFCPVSSWARLRETKLANHRRFHYTTNPFPENTPYHRQHHSQTSVSNIILKHHYIIFKHHSQTPLHHFKHHSQTNYYHRSSCGRTREGSPSLESSHSSTSLAMNEGLTPGTLSFADHLIKCQYTKIIL